MFQSWQRKGFAFQFSQFISCQECTMCRFLFLMIIGKRIFVNPSPVMGDPYYFLQPLEMF